MGLFEATYCGSPVISTDVGMAKTINTIPKFSTVDEAIGLIAKLRERRLPDPSDVQCEIGRKGLTFEGAIGRWETFFSFFSLAAWVNEND